MYLYHTRDMTEYFEEREGTSMISGMQKMSLMSNRPAITLGALVEEDSSDSDYYY